MCATSLKLPFILLPAEGAEAFLPWVTTVWPAPSACRHTPGQQCLQRDNKTQLHNQNMEVSLIYNLSVTQNTNRRCFHNPNQCGAIRSTFLPDHKQHRRRAEKHCDDSNWSVWGCTPSSDFCGIRSGFFPQTKPRISVRDKTATCFNGNKVFMS